MQNILLETIKRSLSEVHTEDGSKEQFDRVCEKLEADISEKILSHEIDFYTENLKV